MVASYVVTGTLSNGRLVELDEALPVADTKVRVRVELLSAGNTRPLSEVIAEIRQRQHQCGWVAPSQEAVDRRLEAERASWED